VILVPSRGRPENLQRFLKAFVNTKASSKIYIRLDIDDPKLSEYQKLDLGRSLVVTGHQVKAAGAMREVFREYPNEKFYGFVGDDSIPRTEKWDSELAKSAGEWGVSYPDDLLKRQSLATHPFVGGNFLRAIGFWALDGLTHLYTDTTWDFLGRLYGNLVYRPDVIVEHMHFSVGKANHDKTYSRIFNGRNYSLEDAECFEKWVRSYKKDPTIYKMVAEFAKESLTK
jgi:hypothetical protein